MIKIRCYNIRYDTDGQDVDLPEKLWVEVDQEYFEGDPDSCVGDAISDATGFCVFGFDYEKA